MKTDAHNDDTTVRKRTTTKKQMPTDHRRATSEAAGECHDGGSMKIIIMNSTRLWNCTMSRWGEHEKTSRINAVTIDTGTQRLILLGGA